MRKASIVAGSVAMAAAGSAIFGGVALAGHHHGDHNTKGGNGNGGDATNNCLNVGVGVLSGIGVAGDGDSREGTCKANANGTGGDAGDY